MTLPRRPIIGCTTYRKNIPQDEPIEMYGLMPSYINAIVAAGGIPLLIPLGLDEDSLLAILKRVDGLLLPGGGDVEPGRYGGRPHPTMWGISPERDQTELAIARHAVDLHKPMFAICRGVQVFNVAMGGTLWEDVKSLFPGAIEHRYDLQPRSYLAHTVYLKPGSVLARCTGRSELRVNSLHHQAIKDLAPGLTVTATAPDGLIEGVEVGEHPFAVGVQWHPENLIEDNPEMLGLFRGLVEAAADPVHHVF